MNFFRASTSIFLLKGSFFVVSWAKLQTEYCMF